MENPIENKPIIPEEKKKEMSALEYDIKNKGENSYYYAHKGRFEEKDKDPNAKTISGPGIITGGDPVLLQTEKRTIEKIKEPKTISKYIFYDDDKFAVVKINLPDDAHDINEDNLEYDFQKKSFHLKINLINGDKYIFKVTKLYLPIDPQKSSVKIIKSKNVIKINFAKVEIDEEWSKLTE